MNIIGNDLHDNILNNMIIIGGSARSGTTIMGKLVHSLENLEYYLEPPLLQSLLLKKHELSKESLKELIRVYFMDCFLLNSLAGRNINFNTNDDSYILHVKDEKEIKKRLIKSYRAIELEEMLKNLVFSFKLPEIVFLIDIINDLFPKSKKILMHRDPNDVINSILKKKWFSDKFLNKSHYSEICAVEIVNDIKIPYWVKQCDKMFWVKSSEIDRSAYYYMRISEEICSNLDKSIVVDYNKFIKNPYDIFENITKKLGLKYGTKTKEVLDTVQFQEKERYGYMDSVSVDIAKKITEFDIKLRKAADV